MSKNNKKKENVGGLIPNEGIRDYKHDMENSDDWIWDSDLRPFESRKKPSHENNNRR